MFFDPFGDFLHEFFWDVYGFGFAVGFVCQDMRVVVLYLCTFAIWIATFSFDAAQGSSDEWLAQCDLSKFCIASGMES